MVFFPEARDNMDGVSLTVTWSASGDPRLAGYRVCYGLHSGVYTDTSEVTDSTTVIGGLMADSTYYFTVYGYYGDGTMSISAREVTGIPRLNPVKPTGLAADPLWHGLRLAWRQNPDPDLAGYRLYRRLNQDPLYDSLNTAWLTDTAFTDSALSAPNRYYYRIRAFDDDGNCSVFSDSAYGRPATLDQGILVVDETQNWTTGSWPRDTTQDQFYDSILVGYRHQDYEFGSAVLRPVLSDLVPYSTVLWHSDDPGQLLASNDSLELRKYLDFGGKLWLVGWKATSNLRGYISYPGNFEAGDFIYDYLKVSAVNLSGTDDSLQGVMGTLGYPGLAVDPAKVPLPLWGGTLRYVESYTPSAEGEVIYNIDMRNNSSSFEGLPCGIRYLGAGYKTVLFGFPLYFMNRDQARLAAQQVMADFGETGVAEGPSCELKVPSLELFQNVPNPFSRTTIIRYQLPKAGQVSLKVYNVAGQLVRTLVEDTQGPGLHSVTWHSDSDHGSKLASGIYFVQLLTGNDSRMSKVILLR